MLLVDDFSNFSAAAASKKDLRGSIQQHGALHAAAAVVPLKNDQWANWPLQGMIKGARPSSSQEDPK